MSVPGKVRGPGWLLLLLCWTQAVGAIVDQAPQATVAPPKLSVPAWQLVDAASGWVIAGHAAGTAHAPASLTKMMTAYIVADRLNTGQLSLDDRVPVSERAWGMPGARMFLPVRSKVEVGVLLKGLAVESANDATVALAEHLAGDEAAFAGLMNDYAKRLGMTGTRFVNSTGLAAEGHTSTAADLARLAVALVRDFPGYYGWFSEREFAHNGLNFYNRNALLWQDSSVDGIKTGQIRDAGYCVAASAMRDDMRLVVVVLGADSGRQRDGAARKLLEYGFRHYESRHLYGPGTVAAQVPVRDGEHQVLALGPGRDIHVTLPRDGFKMLEAEITTRDTHTAPAATGQTLGKVILRYDGRPLAEYPLVALHPVARGSWYHGLLHWFGELWD